MADNRESWDLEQEGTVGRFIKWVVSPIRRPVRYPRPQSGRLRNTAATIKLSNVITMVCLQRYITSGRVTRGVMAHFTDIKLLMKP